MMCAGCQFRLPPDSSESSQPLVSIARYDQLEYRYLTTGDFSALQEMNTEYPIETRTLIEDVIKVGDATDPTINSKLLKFYQDTTLQSIIADVEAKYADIDDLNSSFPPQEVIPGPPCAPCLYADFVVGPEHSGGQ